MTIKHILTEARTLGESAPLFATEEVERKILESLVSSRAMALLAERGLDRADYVISGIPFSTLDADVREEILASTHAVLRPEGALLVYQFSTRVLPHLRRVFSSVQRGFEPLNVLPAQIFVCEP